MAELYHTARFFELERQYSEASKWYEIAARLAECPPLISIRRASLALAMGDFERAEMFLPRCDNLDPYSTALWFMCRITIASHKELAQSGLELSFFSSESATDAAYETAKTRFGSGDGTALKLILIICVIQAVRSGWPGWWARLLVWSEAVFDEPHMSGHVLAYSSVEYGADPLRLAATMTRDERARKMYESLYWADGNRRRPLLYENVLEFPLSVPRVGRLLNYEKGGIGQKRSSAKTRRK